MKRTIYDSTSLYNDLINVILRVDTSNDKLEIK